jgi:hypothetical protein
MAAHIFLADPKHLDQPAAGLDSIALDDDGYYWFLYKYFEEANLSYSNIELIDLYGGGIIEGYQLHRLLTTLEEALYVTKLMPPKWRVLAGWTSEEQSQASENWEEVERLRMEQLIEQLLNMINKSISSNLKFVSSGD